MSAIQPKRTGTNTPKWAKRLRSTAVWCENCKTELCHDCLCDDSATLDHILPRTKGGRMHPTNVQILCRKCNVAKAADLVW